MNKFREAQSGTTQHVESKDDEQGCLKITERRIINNEAGDLETFVQRHC